MKRFLLLLICCSVFFTVNSQTTVIIGNQGYQVAGTGPLSYNSYARFQTIYTAAELSAAGMVANSEITDIAFFILSSSNVPIKDYTIRMGHTTATNFSSPLSVPLTTVRNPADYTPIRNPSDATWDTSLNLDNHFIWNGYDNIGIDICSGSSILAYNNTVALYPYTKGHRSENTSCQYLPFDTYNYRPAIQLTFITCTTPTALSIGAITATSASASFTSVGTAFIVEYGAAGFTPGTDSTAGVGGTVVTGSASPIALTGLTGSTTYDVYVRQNCTNSGAGYSNNSIKATFTTLCMPGGDEVTYGSGTWEGYVYTWTGSPSFNSPNYKGNITESEQFDRDNGAGAIAGLTTNLCSPIPSDGYTVRYKMTKNFPAGYYKFTVGGDDGVRLSIDGGSTWLVNVWNVQSYTIYSSPTVFLNGSTNLVLEYYENAGDSRISFSYTIPCSTPTALSAGGVTNNSANIGFTSAGTAFIVEYGATGFTPGTDNTAGVGGTVVTGSASPIAITGLSGNTAYDVYVRQDCTGGGNGYSLNSSKATFTTLCSPQGDEVSYGNNSWKGYVYTWTGSPSFNTPNYKGYITENEQFDRDNGAGAIAGLTTNLCPPIPSDSFTVRYKMTKNFPAGYYQFTVGGNDGVRLSIDGGNSWLVNDWIDQSYTTYTSPLVYLNGSTNLVLEYYENAGGARSSFSYTIPCSTPTALNAGGVTNNSANISFTGAGTAFIVEYGAAGFTPGTNNTAGVGGTIVTGNASPINLTGLTANTTYDVYVRHDCGNGIYTLNSIKTTFTTLCDTLNVPYTQNFESATVPALPACTSQENLGTGNNWVTVSNPGSGFTSNTLIYQENSNIANVWFYTQGINLTAGTYYTISYRYGSQGIYYPEKLKVAYGTSPSNGAMTNTLADHPNIVQQYQFNSITFTPPSSGVYYFGFKAYSNHLVSKDLYVDDIVVDAIPGCSTPTALSAGSITYSAASISFTGANSDNIVEYGAAGFTPGTNNTAGVGGTIVTGNASPINLTGLTANTTYDVYVRHDCGNGIYTLNSIKTTFTTLCDATNVPYTQNFESATVPVLPGCTVQEQVGSGNLWTTVSNPGNGFTSKALKYAYKVGNAANVWFYTQGVNLTVGTYYTISYRYGNNSMLVIEKLKVAYGTSPSNGAMTNPLADHPNINQATAQSNTVTFTPPSTGVYYFGFKAYSDADRWNLYVDDIVVDVAPWIWTGTTDTDWNKGTNWNRGIIPTPTSNVIIPNVANKPVVGVTISLIREAKNITIETGSSLTIKNESSLLVYGNFTNNGIIIADTGTIAFVGTTLQTFNTGNTDITIKGLGMDNAVGLTLSGTGKLNVTSELYTYRQGVFTTNNLLVLKSNENRTAILQSMFSLPTFVGNVTVERYIPAKASRKWSFLASPINQTLQDSWQQQIHITGAGTGGTVCPALTSHSNGFDATSTNAPSAYTYDASQTTGSRWQAVTNTNATNIGQGKAFRVNVRGSRSLGCDLLNGVNMVPNAVTLSSSGTLSTANKNFGTFSITYPNNGINNWVLIGNPYPANVSFSDLLSDLGNSNAIDSVYAVYIPSNNAGVYSYWSNVDGVFTGGTGYNNDNGNLIASGQAVFVKSKNVGNITLNFNEDLKYYTFSEEDLGYFRNNRRTINEKVKVSYGTIDKKIDEIVVRYDNNVTISNTALGKLDIPSMNYGTYITSLKGTTHTAVQTRSLSTLSTDEVWLNIGATQSGNYTFNFSDYENFTGADIYLVDHLAKITQDVKANPDYVFSVDVNNAATKGSNRFSIVFTKRIVEPSIVNNNIKMYPNPANKQVTLLLPQIADINYNIKVTDMAGKIILQQSRAGGYKQLNIEKLSTGTYIVEIIDSKGNRTTEKLIKN
ncbi:MAG: T9SS type A sorting domain-containing protein [Chitinophagaceae bacterium]|nr:T9SS type A sorting domain-containing protein [Chitinophagaceae bacterium]